MVAEHRPLTILVIVGTAVVLLITMVFTGLALTEAGEDNLFPYGMGREDSVDYASDLKPASWIYRIWIFIFIFQVAWVLYTHTLLCRMNSSSKEYLYYSPPFLPKTLYCIYIIALMMTIAWFFTWDSGFFAASFVSMFACFLSLCICLFFALVLLWQCEHRLSVADMWLNILFLHNGLGLYTTWTFVETLRSFNVMLTAETDVSQQDAGTIALALLLVMFLIYMCCDVFLSKTRLRYHVAPYITLLVALTAFVYDNPVDQMRNTEFAWGVLGVVIFGCVAKVGAMAYRIKMDPLRIEKMCCNN